MSFFKNEEQESKTGLVWGLVPVGTSKTGLLILSSCAGKVDD
jgi:hypothetical protein